MREQPNLEQLLQLQQLINQQIQINQQQLPRHRIVTFNGQITIPSSNNLRNVLSILLNQGAEEITILFSSSGGSVDDGIALFAYIRSFPVKVNIHAMGVVGSIALPVFLSAHNRFASKHSRFFFHEFQQGVGTPIATRAMIDEWSTLMSNALDWYRQILKTETKLTDSDIDNMKLLKDPYSMSPSEALKYEIVRDVLEPSYSIRNIPVVVV